MNDRAHYDKLMKQRWRQKRRGQVHEKQSALDAEVDDDTREDNADKEEEEAAGLARKRKEAGAYGGEVSGGVLPGDAVLSANIKGPGRTMTTRPDIPPVVIKGNSYSVVPAAIDVDLTYKSKPGYKILGPEGRMIAYFYKDAIGNTQPNDVAENMVKMLDYDYAVKNFAKMFKLGEKID
jgi:hypothetical protein